LFHEDPEKPYVIVIDQCDNLRFDEKMKRFIKSLDEGSNCTTKFVVLTYFFGGDKSCNDERVEWRCKNYVDGF
jgi:hypothetical protein